MPRRLDRVKGTSGQRNTAGAILALCLCATLTLPTSALGGAHRTGADYLTRKCRRAAVPDVPECVAELRLARPATERYRDPRLALAGGFVQVSQCESSEAGAMGEHWARLDRMADRSLDPREPEILLYLNAPTGRRLIGAEWEISAFEGGLPHYGTKPPDPTRTISAPAMFGGRVFDGPMQGHNMVAAWPGDFHLTPQPWHYDLHAWLWERNPDGIFAQYNPNLSC